MIKVTPLALATRRMNDEDRLRAVFATPDRHVVLPAELYDERLAIESAASDEHGALEDAWCRFQNIDEDRVTPDGGRSLMVGDMARVEAAGRVSHWICCSIGWTETVAPCDEAVEAGGRLAA